MQGFNMGRYVPPDVEGTVSGNQLHGKRHPIGSSAAPQTVRFEMPFPVWASLVDFGHAADDAADDKALTRPLFAPGHDRNGDGAAPKHRIDGAKIKGKDIDTIPTTARSSPGPSRGSLGQANNKLKSAAKKERTMEGLIQEIGRNTRKIKDPFLEGWTRDSPQRPIALPGLKRKRKREEEEEEGDAITGTETPNSLLTPGEPPDSGLAEVQAPVAAGLVSYDSDSD
ncbi:coiled-coil domain-containing protein 130 [Magnaporthiopsis poae ATCC 64411]|uniref:Coiled-coil domain-containing protein 130 n=1 Tax=Magnaporthiopsis poae (strain ATCC 64411 / 73-15) TaxID=644358 RepID=A0A0C4E028_MAGP6|nr:coiled-coil domain-containing protein 130 [Magnaporthiopsis poae ATCC 64411]